MKVKGLIAAGGEATRLGELTRVVNKHLLPVGGWPMIYYPLQLLQLAGVQEVMIVTGQGHAGQVIDLLGNGQMPERGTATPLFDLDLTYKVQVEAGGIAQVVGMAESFAGSDDLIVCLGDNIFEYAEAAAIRSFVEGDDGAAVFVKDVPDPERFGVVVYGEDGRVDRRGREGRRGRPALRRTAVERRGRRALLLLAGRVRRHPRPPSVVARRARDHRREPPLRRAGHARLPPRQRLVGGRGDAGVAARDRRADRPHRGEQGRVIEGLIRIPLRLFEDDRGWFAELRRESLLPKPTRQTNVSFSRQGVIRGLHYHERGQDDLFACLQGTARVVVLDRATGETFTEDIGEDNPVAIYIPGLHAHGFEALTDLLFCYHVTEEYDPAAPDEQGLCWADPRVKHLWSTDSPILSPRDVEACS